MQTYHSGDITTFMYVHSVAQLLRQLSFVTPDRSILDRLSTAAKLWAWLELCDRTSCGSYHSGIGSSTSPSPEGLFAKAKLRSWVQPTIHGNSLAGIFPAMCWLGRGWGCNEELRWCSFLRRVVHNACQTDPE